MLTHILILLFYSSFSQNGIFENIRESKDLDFNQVFNVINTSDDQLLFATDKGVYHYDGLFFNQINENAIISHFLILNDSIFGINSLGEVFLINKTSCKTIPVSDNWKKVSERIINTAVYDQAIQLTISVTCQRRI